MKGSYKAVWPYQIRLAFPFQPYSIDANHLRQAETFLVLSIQLVRAGTPLPLSQHHSTNHYCYYRFCCCCYWTPTCGLWPEGSSELGSVLLPFDTSFHPFCRFLWTGSLVFSETLYYVKGPYGDMHDKEGFFDQINFPKIILKICSSVFPEFGLQWKFYYLLY